MTPGAREHRPQKTAMILARRIVSEIQRLELAPGDRLPSENAMLEQYEVGRGTLREALRFLELQDVISLKPGPGGGPIVGRPGAAALAGVLGLVLQFDNVPRRQAVEFRRDLEVVCAGLAVPRAGAGELSALRELLEEMQTAAGEAHSFSNAQRRFHLSITRMTGNSVYPLLVGALIDLADEADRRHASAPHRDELDSLVRVYEALATGDADAAREAMQGYWETKLRLIGEHFPGLLDERIAWPG